MGLDAVLCCAGFSASVYLANCSVSQNMNCLTNGIRGAPESAVVIPTVNEKGMNGSIVTGW